LRVINQRIENLSMKIINNNIRAAKRTVYRPFRGSCGGIPSGFVSEEEFEKGHKDPYDNDEFSRSHDEPEEFTQNRTHKKSENDVCERESDPTSEST